MKPILFDAKATVFNTNGIGRLKDCIKCTVTEERNGIYECELTYPVTGQHYSDIEISRIVVVKVSSSSDLQAFRIFRISTPINGQVTISCRHISYQLSYIPVRAFSANSLAGALSGFKSNALEPCPFTLSADFTSSSSFAIPLPASIKSYLAGRDGSIIDIYGNGAEWEWNNYNCVLHKNRGADRGVVLRYGKNIKDLQQETNIEDTITGILPYWVSDETRVILSAPIESASAKNFPFPRTVVMDFSDKFDNAPTTTQLANATQQYITQNKIGIPKVSMKVSFIDLADTVEYKHLSPTDIRLCDTVTINFEKLNIVTKAKVVKTVYDVLTERYDNIEIGDNRATFSATVEEQAAQISARPTTDQMQTNIDRATGVLNSGLRGHVIINRNREGWANEILFLDDENVAKAKNVLRINTNGIGFSSTGYNGPFYQSWTIDGHFALGGINNAYGDFEILDSSGKALGQWNKDGLRFFDSAQKLLLAINHGGMYLYDANGKTLAQLTPKGLNVYEGSIEGGTIKIGKNFSVDRDGKMKATSAEFTGDIKGGTIKIGQNFSVDNTGKMKATSAEFTGDIKGGTININSRFKVDKDGNLNARFTGGSIEIGKNFKVDSNGKMTATSASFSGNVTGSNITGSTFTGAGGKFKVDENGKMTANGGTFNGGEITINGKRDKLFWTGFDEEGTQEVHIGGFKVWEYGEGAYLGSEDKEVFMGDNENMCFVTGWDGEHYANGTPSRNLNNNYFGVVIDYENVYCQDVYCSHSAFWGDSSDRWWSLGECLDWIYDEIDDLKNEISSLRSAINNSSGGE